LGLGWGGGGGGGAGGGGVGGGGGGEIGGGGRPDRPEGEGGRWVGPFISSARVSCLVCCGFCSALGFGWPAVMPWRAGEPPIRPRLHT
jgi:hypothetical protein